MRPYISIDIETTGLDDRSEILQISGVIDTGEAIADLKTFDLPIKHDSFDYSEPYAMGMNAELLKKMMDKDFVTYEPRIAIDSLLYFMKKCFDKDSEKVMFAGKNVASFDIPKIRSFIIKHGCKDQIKDFDKMCHYKTLDVGSLYFDVFYDNVSLSRINELTGRTAVTHNALDDAWDVVFAIRNKLVIK